MEWYVSGITLNYLKKDLKKYPLLGKAIDYLEKNVKPNRFVMNLMKDKVFRRFID